MPERLQKYLSACGVGSRRACEGFIKEGLVTVNGAVVREMGFKVDPTTDQVAYRGKLLKGPEERVTVLLHKPPGYVTTAREQFGRPTVLDLVDIPGVRLYPVGRLDYGTSGLLLLTNDGELTFGLTHPSGEVIKVYRAVLRGSLTQEEMKKLEEGVVLDDGYRTRRCKVRKVGMESGNTCIEITITEGKNRQVRRMAEAIHHPVLRLKRIQEGKLKLGTLREGAYRVLSPKEVESLKNEVLR